MSIEHSYEQLAQITGVLWRDFPHAPLLTQPAVTAD